MSLPLVTCPRLTATCHDHCLTATCHQAAIDLNGTKPLTREIKILSDAFALCRFPLRELSVGGRMLGLEGSASLLDAVKDCPLQVMRGQSPATSYEGR